MRHYKTVYVLISLLACLARVAFPQCPPSTTLTEEQRELENRSVLLTVKLSNGGVVLDANVIRGPEALRGPAIRAAKARKYKHRIVSSFPDSHEMMVMVTFPRDGSGKPDVRQALSTGAPSCVYPTMARVSSEIMQSRLIKRVDPVSPAGMRNFEGTIVLEVGVDKDGNVYRVYKLSGPDELVEAATEAVKQWKYEPYVWNGTPLEVETTVELKFSN